MELSQTQFRALVTAVVWALLLGAAAFFFSRLKETTQKKRAVPWAAALLGLTLLGLSLYLGLPFESLLLTAPLVLVSAWLNVRKVVFCTKCSAFHFAHPRFPTRFCRLCGTPLKKSTL